MNESSFSFPKSSEPPNLTFSSSIAFLASLYSILKFTSLEELKVKFGGSELFGNEKDDSFKSSIATIDQTFSGQDLYPSIEEKAANLLYFVVKNHSFTDGNKRIAAWLFVWYLNKNNHLFSENGKTRVANNALAALTLMVALSKPEEKDLIIKVIINSINRDNEVL